jgi:hypothetical protein
MRTFIIGVVLAVAGPAFAATSPAKRVVNLDAPGSLEAVERENPQHYAKIVEIIRVAQSEPCETLPKILKTRLDVPDVECRSYQVLTSHPPKMHMTFTIGDVRYTTNAVQYKIAGGKIVPVR